MIISSNIKKIIRRIDIKTGFYDDGTKDGIYFASDKTFGLTFYSLEESEAVEKLEKEIAMKLMSEPLTLKEIEMGDFKLNQLDLSE